MDITNIGKIPESSGVYLLKNKKNEIIYIGKAKNLKKRLISYFNKSKKDLKTNIMTENIDDFDYIITKNEFEAFLLENTLIKQHKPKYNILLKDDKSFPYIKLTINEKYPGLYLVRETKNKNSIYFGPYFANEAKKILEIIYNIFKIRQCKLDLKKTLSRPCIYYDTGMCAAPCVKFISESSYNEIVKNVIKFLRGKLNDIKENLKHKMEKYAESQEYEKAAKVRDYIKALDLLKQQQKVVLNTEKDIDVINHLFSDNNYYFCVLKIRDGRLLNKEIISFKNLPENENPVDIFLLQYYSRNIDMPYEIWLPSNVRAKFVDKIFLKNAIKIIYKQRDALLNLAMENIFERVKQDKSQENLQLKYAKQLLEIQRSLGFDMPVKIIDGIDISHFCGQNTVGSCVVFKNGMPDKNLYRRYKIKEQKFSDDYAAIKEVVSRRYSRLKKENSELPDLILIDGGCGQVNVAYEELKKININVKVIGLAKKEELIYKPYCNEPVKISEEALLLLKRIRDEAHRFALSYQTKLSGKTFKKSLLEQIPFIGKKTIYRIYNEFKSLDELLSALKCNSPSISFLNQKQKNILIEILKKDKK